ncbi:tail protein [Pseudoalteromonas luteoviolacea]|uniref:Phage tail sheath monomer n=1 Tax=Pseudoalteromonas luteoviolacea TaxID=43657 RepID=A0A023PZJ4_9GAMM|nr:phage tail sheath C-terminal domain-containing protein [Pseudoalteromonas luteoviolacea]AHX39970.1 phage tail sheath monomer [Pseudoalteromonas luteoviolacea]KID58284.1 tail protein [Pseudoalteromonas luteoviolacea]
MSGFLHGVEVIEAQTGTRPIKTVKSSVIGLIGTAPFADKDAFPLNKPVLVAGKRADAAGLIDPNLAAFQQKLTERKDAAAAAVAGSEALQLAEGKAAAAKGSDLTAQEKAEILAKLEQDAKDSIKDILDKDKGSLFAAIDGIFDQAGAAIVVVRVADDANDATVMSNMVGGVNAQGEFEGVHAFLGAESELGFSPRILVATGYTHQRPLDSDDNPLKNPVVAEMQGIAERLRAVIIADGPSGTNSEAIAYRSDFGSRRVFVVDPHVKVFKNGQPEEEPASARVAGMIAKSDNDRGFWWSPSNTAMNGIVGTQQAIDFQLGDRNARANLLNENEVATIIRQNGFKLWGNRTCATDPKWAFLSVVRTADMINDSLLRAHMWAVDRNITSTYIKDVTESVQAYLDSLKAQGAILGGQIWADEDLNTPENIQAGKVYFSFDFTPPTPAEHITFKSILTNNYLEEIV